MMRPGRIFLAPGAALAFVVLAVAADLWRGDPPPPEPAPVHVPAVPFTPPFVVEGPVRDPFRTLLDEERPAVRSASPARARSFPAPAAPKFSGIVTRDGRTFLIAAEGLIPVGGTLGPWTVVSASVSEVQLAAGPHTLRMTPTGQVAR